MRKIMILVMAFLLPFTALEMRADDEVQISKIPLRNNKGNELCRNVSGDNIISNFYVMFSCVETLVTEDLGEVTVIVTNTSTGEFWSDTFDSATERQSFLQISGSQGYYEIEYITESGDVYSGQFLIE